ncbi:MAG: cell division protein SepF [Candidatus Thermoplasmatota archaeon]|nr:cell division protein SepF [Candidatus Thermoplasmatota archaeon]MCL5963252.1 cell division protein SepF [Candidatus Thermoplasmatota archaeon]
MVDIFHSRKKHESFDQKDDFIDLSNYDVGGRLSGNVRSVKVAEINKYDDMAIISKELYDGNVLIIDYSAISNDELLWKRVVSDLKKIVADTGGDMAGVSSHLMMITNSDLRINREKLKMEMD